MVKTGQTWAGTFVTLDATGALAAGTPAGVLYVDGVANGATVTITGSNPYKFSVTLPALTAGQRVDMYITATISTIATAAIVASEQADTSLLSDVKTDTAAILADTGTDGVKLAADQAVDVTKIGGQAISGNNAVLKLKALDIQNSGGNAVNLVSTGSNGSGLRAAGHGTGSGIKGIGGETGFGVFAQGGSTTGHGIYSYATGETNSDGIVAYSVQRRGFSMSGAVQGLVITDGATESGVKLANDAITAAKFDESTAFPVKSADTGATQIARVGADSDTLETLSDQMDAIKTETAAIVADTNELQTDLVNGGRVDLLIDGIKAKTDLITTGTTVTIASAVSGSTITAIRGDSLSAALEDIGSLVGYSKVYFTVKGDKADADTAAIIQIEKAAGLKYINGAAATTAANGSITIQDEATGDITVILDEAETAKLSPGQYYYDVQIVRTAGTVATLTEAVFNVSADITRAVT